MPIYEQVRRAAEECGHEIPQTVAERPQIKLWDRLYWDCFNDLSNCRPFTMGGMGFIPWTAINQWAIRYKVDDSEQFTELQRMVEALDLAWVEHYRDERERTGAS